MSILIVTVNYKNSKPTENLVKSLMHCKINMNLKILIIDNESSENSFNNLKMIRKKGNLNIKIIRSTKNLYYWGGVNLGIKKYYDKQIDYKWIIVCNNDVQFDDINFFEKLNNINEKSCGIIAPSIKSSLTKNDLNPFMIEPISLHQDIYYSIYYKNFFTARIVHKIGRLIQSMKNKMKNQNLSNNKIYAPHGSCMIFNKDFFLNGGFLETGFTMYGEEVSTAEIAKKINSEIIYFPSLSLIHNDHQSTGQSSLRENFLHSKSTYYFLKKKYRS